MPAVRDSGAVPTVTLSEAVAVTVRFTALATDAGAVYNPLLEIEPGAGLPGLLALLMLHVTALFGVPVTCAVYCCVCPPLRLAPCGVTLTPISELSKNTPLIAAFDVRVRRGDDDFHVAVDVPDQILAILEAGRVARIEHVVGAGVENLNLLGSAALIAVPIQCVQRHLVGVPILQIHIQS